MLVTNFKPRIVMMKTYGNPPKSLLAFAEKHADKVCEVGDERGMGDGYWIYLNTGWCWDDTGLHSIHEDTVARAIQAFRDGVRQCTCKDCVTEMAVRP